MAKKSASPLYQAIYLQVQRVPVGFVTTYGRIGQLVGCSARTVGFALAALPSGSDVPWQRVVNRQGKVSLRRDGEGNILQYDLLVAEGVSFSSAGKIDLERFAFKPPPCDAGGGD